MSLAVATIPDDPAAVPRWLDEQLVGDRLGDLAEELAGLQGDLADALQPGWLDRHRAALLTVGTAALPDDAIRGLVRDPAALLQLQELIFLEGGPYWDAVLRSDSLGVAADRLRESIWDAAPRLQGAVQLSAHGWRQEALRWATSFALAAALLIAVIVTLESARPARVPGGVAWGWAKPGALPDAATARDYYAALAAGAKQWKAQRPVEAAELATRLHELRQGCSTLILAGHAPLSLEQAADLRQRCRKWAANFDAAIAELERPDGKAPLAVRGDVDSVVDKLIDYLEGQAEIA